MLFIELANWPVGGQSGYWTKQVLDEASTGQSIGRRVYHTHRSQTGHADLHTHIARMSNDKPSTLELLVNGWARVK